MSLQRLITALIGLAYMGAALPAAKAQDVELAKRINEAIDKGVAHVKAFGEAAGPTGNPAGPSLRGWALLEAGVAGDDDAIQKIARLVRAQVPDMDRVYDLSLSIIFLDKLADPGDVPLIESMAVRLLAGQRNHGGWDYAVDRTNDGERNRLVKLIKDSEEARKQGFAIRSRKRSGKEIAADIDRQFKAIELAPMGAPGDNSNTQFAMIAVWVARRHGLPVEKSMALIEKRFRDSQLESGEWGYQFPLKLPWTNDSGFTYPAMTCAGLLGLALGQGVQPKPRDLTKDNQVKRGLEVLAKAMDEPPKGKAPNFHYFLFSMERVAVVYHLQTIGDHDWYLWGVQKLVNSQAKNGSWSAGFLFDAADTCFALLFLKRANVARDLTEILRVPLRK